MATLGLPAETTNPDLLPDPVFGILDDWLQRRQELIKAAHSK